MPEVAAPNIQTSKNSSAVALGKAAAQSEKLMRPFREQRQAFVKSFVGPYYGEGSDNHAPFNLLFSLVSTLVPTLVIDPKGDVTTTNELLGPVANAIRLACDSVADEIRLAKVFREAVINSLFGLGIIKTYLAPTEAAGFDPEGNLLEDPGKVIAKVIDEDDWIPDTTARKLYEMAYQGNRAVRPFDWAMDSGLYDRIALEKAEKEPTTGRVQRTEDIWRGGKKPGDSESDFVRRIEMVDLWVPHENIIVTLPGNLDDTEDYLAVAEYDGPETGPNDILGFIPVPGNLMPLPLIAVIYDLYVLINKQARKIARQAGRQKDIGVYSLGAEAAATAVTNASDGEMVAVADKNEVAVLSFGGAKEEGYRAVAWFDEYFNKIAGNPDVVGGTQKDADTLGQDVMKLGQAGVRLNDWRGIARAVGDSVYEKIAWHMWNDPDMERELMGVGADGAPYQDYWNWSRREGDFLDYNFHLSIHHRPDMSPDERYDRLKDVVHNIYLPLAQIAAPQGRTLDVDKIQTIAQRLVGLDIEGSLFIEGEPVDLNLNTAGAKQETRINMGQPSPARVEQTKEPVGAKA